MRQNSGARGVGRNCTNYWRKDLQQKFAPMCQAHLIRTNLRYWLYVQVHVVHSAGWLASWLASWLPTWYRYILTVCWTRDEGVRTVGGVWGDSVFNQQFVFRLSTLYLRRQIYRRTNIAHFWKNTQNTCTNKLCTLYVYFVAKVPLVIWFTSITFSVAVCFSTNFFLKQKFLLAVAEFNDEFIAIINSGLLLFFF